MDTAAITQIAIQLPLVAAFVWFSLELQKRFQEALDRRDDSFTKRNDKVCEALSSLTAQLLTLTKEMQDHDAKVAERILASEDKVKARIDKI